MTANKVIIGNEEWCAFPGLAIPAIKARVDSGAKTSALHAFNIQPFTRENNPWVRFSVHPLQNNREQQVVCECEVIDQRWVKSSSGASEKRFVIKVPVVIGEFHLNIEISLTNRDSMGYRMLLGRNAMENYFLIDPAGSCYLGKPSKKHIRQHYPVTIQQPAPVKILIIGQNADDYPIVNILQVLTRKGYQVTFRQINNSIFNACVAANNHETDYVDVVLAWAEGKGASLTCTYLQYFQRLGAASINSAQVIRQALDVASTHQILQQHNIATVETDIVLGSQALHAFLDATSSIDTYLFSRICYGFSPVYTVLGADELHLLPDYLSIALNDYLLVQKLPNAHCQRISCLVAFDTVLAAIHLPFSQHVQQGEAATLSMDEQVFVLNIASALHLKLASIDIIRHNHSLLFIALTPTPDLAMFDHVSGRNMAESLVGLIEQKWQSKVVHHG